jgi:hypothetical protein
MPDIGRFYAARPGEHRHNVITKTAKAMPIARLTTTTLINSLPMLLLRHQ